MPTLTRCERLPDVDAENDVVDPLRVHSFSIDDRRAVRGYLVIDSQVNGICGGGVRMAPDVTPLQLAHLARSMTFKSSFLNLPIGGAKAGIAADPQALDAATRTRIVQQFAEHLVPLRRSYLPGQDMGTGDADLALIYRALGLGRYNAGIDTAYYTALTVLICTEELARAQLGKPLAECSAAIEGFGRIGSWVATLLAERGVRVVAASTLKGAIYETHGLDIAELQRLRRHHGDACIDHYRAAQALQQGELLTLDVDLLIPCASFWSVCVDNVGAVRAGAIVCGANKAVTDRAKVALSNRQVTCFPDFVSSVGGMLGSMLERFGLGRDEAARFIEHEFRVRVAGLLRRARSEGRLIEQCALATARANARRRERRENAILSWVSTTAVDAIRRRFAPASLMRQLGPAIVRRAMNAGALSA